MALDRVRFEVGEYLLVPLEEVDADKIALFHTRNRERFAPYAPLRTEFFYTAEHWVRAKSRSKKERRQETALRWMLVDKKGVYAQIGLDQITRGVVQAASLGYVLDETLEGQGVMTACLKHVLRHAFEALDLHRVVANHIPENSKSEAVLTRLGFEKEGLAKSYLKLEGVWKDHVLNALINPAHKDT
ncbi:GNAT family N-acetyltransferase [Hirschia maritima]|uniref:GNAT family N-acetyltransferase n=1 Tax=Hirschia maritima TaxID=1121961 RepID=UPI00037C91E4|nr:GNAT family N-acetyltransferase [Hirschia maritima]